MLNRHNFCRSNADIPLGVALDGTTVELRDTHPVTGIGKLWIGGVNRVCLIDKEKSPTPGQMRFSGDLVKRCTARRQHSGYNNSISDRSNIARLYYVSRADDVIKRNGKMINLLEISTVRF